MADEPQPPVVVPLDKLDTNHALRMALSTRRFGHSKRVVKSALHDVVAELLTDALLEAGYVVARPEQRDPTDRRPMRSNPQLMD